MTKIKGHVKKMASTLGSPVSYTLRLDEQELALNAYLGESISIAFTGDIHCANCSRKTKKSYSQGFCFPCCQRLAQCDLCIMRPHTCHFDKGTCREPDWALSHCFQDHYVYLANSSGLKVGITRQDQLPTRWIDQGATQALPIFKTRSRYVAGVLEKALSDHVSDRTDWRKMLKGNAEPLDLVAKKATLIEQASEQICAIAEQFAGRFETDAFDSLDEQIVELAYPVNVWPEKIKAHNLDKTPQVSGVLEGIKGQYLLLDTGVLNVRKYTSYEIEFTG